MELSKTAMEISSASEDVLKDKTRAHVYLGGPVSGSQDDKNTPLLPLPSPLSHENDRASQGFLQQSFRMSIGTPSLQSPSGSILSTLTSQRSHQMSLGIQFIRACMQRTFMILSAQYISLETLGPYFALPLSIAPRDKLQALALELSSSIGFVLQGIPPPSYPESRSLPGLYRIIEGFSGFKMLPRKASPFVQCLEFGRTRTVLQTDLPELQGEWLEPTDVQEYLQERGIHVRTLSQSPDSIIDVQNGTTTSARNSTVASISPMTSSIEDSSSAIFSQFSDNATIHENCLEGDFKLPDTINDSMDLSIFGHSSETSLPVPSGCLSFTPTLLHTANESETEGLGSGTTQCPRMIINLDKLVENLAAQAVCLGAVPGIRKTAVDRAIRESIVTEPSVI